MARKRLPNYITITYRDISLLYFPGRMVINMMDVRKKYPKQLNLIPSAQIRSLTGEWSLDD